MKFTAEQQAYLERVIKMKGLDIVTVGDHIQGDVKGHVKGSVFGFVKGDVWGSVFGKVLGTVAGKEIT